MSKYRISYDNPLPGMVKPYVIERHERWIGWQHVTRVDDPAELGTIAASDASQRSFKPRTVVV